MESNSGNTRMEAKKDARPNTPARITITSRRKRLCDVDGISAKAIIDGLVHCGILQDDGPQFVAEIKYRQEKVSNEADEVTVVEIDWEEA